MYRFVSFCFIFILFYSGQAEKSVIIVQRFFCNVFSRPGGVKKEEKMLYNIYQARYAPYAEKSVCLPQTKQFIFSDTTYVLIFHTESVYCFIPVLKYWLVEMAYDITCYTINTVLLLCSMVLLPVLHNIQKKQIIPFFSNIFFNICFGHSEFFFLVKRSCFKAQLECFISATSCPVFWIFYW